MKIVFVPSYKEISCEQENTILDAAREAGVYLDSVCGGIGKCGKCKVRIVSGEANPLAPEELAQIPVREQNQGFRLACRGRLLSDATVFVPERTVLKGQATRKEFTPRKIAIDPAVKTYMLTESKEKVTAEDVKARLEEGLGGGSLSIDEEVLKELPSLSHDGASRMTASVWMDREVIRVQTGAHTGAYGVALDIGTTTLALYLVDIGSGKLVASSSATNPQTIFGEDIMSRIAYSVNHPGDGVKKMQHEVAEVINTMIREVSGDKGITPLDVVDMTVVGNTVMHHIFLGLAPDRLGFWPFTPTVQASVNVKARNLGIDMLPSAHVHVLPVEAGFVGADNVAVLIAEEPYAREEISLVIDIGTNGELALGNRAKMLSCSCATGPALEGAQIAFGMRAAPGAIERVTIDPKSLEPDYKVIGNKGWKSEGAPAKFKPVGMCGSGILDAIAALYRAAIIGKNGAFSKSLDTPRLRRGTRGQQEFVLAWADETPINQDIVITQRDVRQIQLAKAAIHAGCRIMMNRLNISTPDRLIIAGAFGMHIDKDKALAIGLLPACDPGNISFVGNAAGHGAYLALLNRGKREEADRIARWTEHIELATEPSFQKEFIKGLDFPT
jgi:uncharacterized 2Fe-2S/4Fe-4S cluster protein (DUF4445 family)